MDDDKYKRKYKALKVEFAKSKKKVTEIEDELESAKKSAVAAKEKLKEEKSECSIAQAQVVEGRKIRAELQSTVESLKAKLSKVAEPQKEARKGWEKHFPNHNGKLVPSENSAEQCRRLGRLVRDGVDRIEIQKGRFVLLLDDARCYGYHSEVGSNIIVPRNTEIPSALVDLAKTHSLKVLQDKNEERKEDRRKTVFVEFVTALQYSFCGDHQGPVYINGMKPSYKSAWTNSESISVRGIINEQPDLLRTFIDLGLQHSKLDKTGEDEQRTAIIRVLQLIFANHRKQGFTLFGSTRGRAARKLILPKGLKPLDAVLKANAELPQLPPTCNRDLEGVKVGDWNPKPKKGKKRQVGAANVDMDTTVSSKDSDSGKEEVAKKKAPTKSKNKKVKFPNSTSSDSSPNLELKKKAKVEQSEGKETKKPSTPLASAPRKEPRQSPLFSDDESNDGTDQPKKVPASNVMEKLKSTSDKELLRKLLLNSLAKK